jgi:nanoRNase/pAp phosphatase (c-di-AMP/oligoRNAs hydrolase)
MLSPIGNRRIKAKKDAFVKLVNENKDKKWIICSHDNPDPDSIASCLGMSHILSFLGVEDSVMTYCKQVGHSQNRAMVNVLQLRITKWEDLELSEEDRKRAIYIFVDCTFGQKNMSIKEMPKIVIDHHKIPTTNKEVLYLHDEVGACSTLVLDLALSVTHVEEIPEISDENPIADAKAMQCFDPDEEGTKELATALAIGIKTDTQDFLNETTTQDDFQAFRLLGKHLSDEKFGRIVNYELPPYVLDYEQTAWQNKRAEFQPHFITGLGYIDDSKSDCIPHVADKFVQLQGVQIVVVYGIVENGIRASVRTSSAAHDCQTLCDEIFGKGNGGTKTKANIGGARVPFNVFCPLEMDEDDKELLWSLTKRQIERRFELATTK